MHCKKLGSFLAVAILLTRAAAGAPIAITEWMYDGLPDEYVEFTNVSGSSVDMTNWSEDDNDHIPGKHSFGNTFGVIQPGQSVVMTAAPEATFRTAWNLPASVKVWAGATGTGYTDDNLGRSDEINLYDSLGALVDSLTYNDQGSGNVKGPRTQNSSGNIPLTRFRNEQRVGGSPIHSRRQFPLVLQHGEHGRQPRQLCSRDCA